MEETSKYKLKKPGENDYCDVAVLNENTDKLDAALYGLETGKADLVDGKVPAAQLPKMDYDPAGSALAVEAKLIAHTGDAVPHVTEAERAEWNAKETPEGAQAKADAAEAAAKAGSRPVTWTPTAAEVGAYTKAEADVSLSNKANQNLLDNPDFGINRRLRLLYNTSGQETVSRWHLDDATRQALVSVNADKSITFSIPVGALDNAWLTQSAPWGASDETHTISCLVAEVSGSVVLYMGVTGVVIDGPGVHVKSGKISSEAIARFVVSPGSSVTIKWVKVEKGTGASAYYPPNRAEQWAICSNYDEVTGVYQGVPLATATPPQELPLPLEAGVSVHQGLFANYHKNQFGETTLIADLVGDFFNAQTIATLPFGYRPTGTLEIPADFVGTSGRIQIGTDGQIRCIISSSKPAVAFCVTFVAQSDPIASQSTPVRMSVPVARMARSATPKEPEKRLMCVVDTAGNYVEFVQVTITYDKEGALYDVYAYAMQNGETLVDSPRPPTYRTHAGTTGLIKPVWNFTGKVWLEAATAEEIAAWELEHPAPVPPGPSPLEDADAMMVDHEYRITLLELGVI